MHSKNSNESSVIEFLSKNLTKETSLFTLYKSSRKVSDRRFNKIVTFLSAGALIVNVWMDPNAACIVSTCRNYADAALGFSSTMLGFFVAGIAILTTMARPDLQVCLAKIEKDDLKISHLEFDLFVYFRVFMVYLVVLCIFCSIRSLILI